MSRGTRRKKPGSMPRPRWSPNSTDPVHAASREYGRLLREGSSIGRLKEVRNR